MEKRAKLREHTHSQNIPFNFLLEELPSSGSSKVKTIADALKKLLPSFQYFKADSSLSDAECKNTLKIK
ncbi:hypothetical protein [Pedobacter heparinus]|uniref:hypothetical protein n=1 Tax=Pedobacter heparinus TaxID=984 RepID=UPI00019ED079|nr:hypothetical protein [Pedobacter heparinus]